MKITIFSAGSQGDIQPCLALSKGLKRAGYQVNLAAPENFSGFAADHGISFSPLRGDVQKVMAGETGQNFMGTGSNNPIHSVRAMRELIGSVVMPMAADAFTACWSADAVICLGVLSAFGHSIAEALDIPILHIEPTPLLPTKTFPAPSWPIQRNLGGIHNRISGAAMLQVVWQWYRPFVKDFRKSLELPKYSFGQFLRDLRTTPTIGAYSPSLIPHPADWPENIHITGPLFLDSPAGWEPSPELLSFLEEGNPPVYLGFGSMGGQNPGVLADIAIDALCRSGLRGVLNRGWGGLQPEMVPPEIFVVDSVPHNWLFPRTAAVVHHGGAGTTSEGLRAGVPNVIVPFVFDQHFWGAQVQAIGAGPEPLPHKQLTSERLTESIRRAASDQQMQLRAKSLGQAIRNENGLENAVKIVEHYLGKAKNGKGMEHKLPEDVHVAKS